MLDLLTAAENRPVVSAEPPEPDYGPVFHLVNDAIFVHDAETGATLDVNRRAEEMYGLSRSALVAASVADLSEGRPPYGQAEALAHLRAAASGGPRVFAWRARHRSGELFWVEVNLKRAVIDGKDRLLAVVRDVTDRMRAEDALREAERRVHDVLDAIPQLVWTADASGHGDFVSRQWEEYTGEPVEALVVECWIARAHPDDRAATLDAWRRAVATGEAFQARVRLQRHDGAWRWFRTRAVALRDAEGRITRWFGTNTDEDDQVRAEAELREADRRKSEFLGVLSHELRNPLAPIRNGLYLLDRARPGSPQAARAKQVIERQTEHLTRLVDDLLDVTRISRGKIELQPSSLDLRDVVQRTCDDHRALFDRRGVALAVASNGPAWVHADPTRVAQVVGNLLQNAAKFSREGGTVAVTVSTSVRSAEVRVRDDGIGIAPELLPRVFDPFVQADLGIARTQGGLGLGLALVKGLVELHGGSVRATSAGAGRGSEFVIALPLAAPRQQAGAECPAQPAVRAVSVLVVEDNVDAAQTIAEVLEFEGLRVHVANDGRAGLARARELRPDVILCDIGLPDLDGCEVARRLRADAALRATRLVALSGYAQPEDRRRAREAGFDAHLAKPVSVAELVAALSRAP